MDLRQGQRRRQLSRNDVDIRDGNSASYASTYLGLGAGAVTARAAGNLKPLSPGMVARVLDCLEVDQDAFDGAA